MGDTGRDRPFPLPEGQQWMQAQVDQYVWGDPAIIERLGQNMDAAGTELVEIADSLKGVDVSGYWRGEGAQGFTGLRDKLEPAVRGLGAMHDETAAALSRWKSALAQYKSDAEVAIRLGRQGFQEHEKYGGPDGTSKMARAKTTLDAAKTLAEQSGRTTRSAIDAAVAKAAVPVPQPAGPVPDVLVTQQPVPPLSSEDGERGRAPSGREPVPAPPPYAAGWYVDPGNGQLVTPRPGQWEVGQQQWDYAPGSAPNPAFVVPVPRGQSRGPQFE